MSEKECYFDDVRHHFNSIDTLLQVIEDENALLKREVNCQRKENSELEDTLEMVKGYNKELTKWVENLKVENSKLKRQNGELCLEIAKLVQEKSKLENENFVLDQDANNKFKMAGRYRQESIRNRIEADLWKLMFEYGLEDVLDKFYIEVPEETNTWRYVHFLVNKDYDGERPEFDVSQQFTSGRVVFMWYKDRDGFDAETEFEKAVKYAKQGAVELD